MRRDVGVCFFLQSSVHRDIARGELRWVQTPGMQMSIPLYLVVRKDKELSPFQQALRLYIEAARPTQVRPFERAGAGTAAGTSRGTTA